MLYVCIPTYNEAPTVGVLLWRIRKVFESYPREYEVIVLDDGSTDATAATLQGYMDVMPLTIVRHEARRGYAASVSGLLQAAAGRTRYPRRDAAILMQADFTDQPEHLPELVKRFEGGADVVVAERPLPDAAAPLPVKRLRRLAGWAIRPFARVAGVQDPFGSFRLFRVAVIRDLLREAGDRPLLDGEGWAANVDLLVKAARVARRVETVTLASRYDLRYRDSRIRPFADAMSVFRFGRASRGRRLSPST